MKYYVTLFSAVPDGQKPPGVHPDWPVTKEEVADDAPDPGDGRLVMTVQELQDYMAAEQAEYDAANTANAAAQAAWRDSIVLPGAKAQKFREIDRRTDEIIAEGFVYDTKTFSLSIESQVKILGAFTGRDSLTYPIIWNTIDDLDSIQLDDAADVIGMYTAAIETVREALDGGTTLKASIRAATTIAGLDAIVDTR